MAEMLAGVPVHLSRYLPGGKRAAEWKHVLLDDCPWPWLRKFAQDEESTDVWMIDGAILDDCPLFPRLHKFAHDEEPPEARMPNGAMVMAPAMFETVKRLAQAP